MGLLSSPRRVIDASATTATADTHDSPPLRRVFVPGPTNRTSLQLLRGSAWPGGLCCYLLCTGLRRANWTYTNRSNLPREVKTALVSEGR